MNHLNAQLSGVVRHLDFHEERKRCTLPICGSKPKSAVAVCFTALKIANKSSFMSNTALGN